MDEAIASTLLFLRCYIDVHIGILSSLHLYPLCVVSYCFSFAFTILVKSMASPCL